LSLALLVLTNAFLLESLGAHEPADGFLCGADVLVPGAGGAVVVVFCDAARGGDGEGAGFGGGVWEVFFDGGYVFAVLALDLKGVRRWKGGWGERVWPTLSALFPVKLPSALCTAPVAESTYDCSVEVWSLFVLEAMFADVLSRSL
jgi:hypothetical protein